MNIVYIDHPFSHHGTHSGYKLLGRYNDSRSNDQSIFGSTILDLFPEKYLNRYLRLNSNWYSKKSLAIELEISKQLAFYKDMIYHFLYGENSFRLTGKVNHLTGNRNKVIATYHQIPMYFEKRRPQFKHLRSLDAVVLVASNQVEFFSSIMDADKIHVIPHGVDTDFFRPSDEIAGSDQKRTILTVGTNYRDIELHLSVIKAINGSRIGSNVEFQIIGEPRFLETYSGIDNVHFYSGISDYDLLQKYRHADVLLMPLLETTANNGVLEAMACGIPIVITDVGGIRDYVDESCAVFCPPHEFQCMVQALEVLINDEGKCKSLGQAARDKAVKVFSWELIATQVNELYCQLSSRRNYGRP